MSFPTDHEAIIAADERGRLNLRKFLGSRPGVRFKVFVSDDRNEVRLQAIE